MADKQYELGYGHLGNGLTVWNRLEERDGDYVTLAHIGADRSVTLYESGLPESIVTEIEQLAQTSDAAISATQDTPVFDDPAESAADEKRMVQNYEVKNAIHIGGKEVIIAEDLTSKDPYMVCECRWDNPFGAEIYSNAVVGSDYLEAMAEFLGRTSAEVWQIRDERARRGVAGEPLTAADCIPGSNRANYEGQLVVIRPESMVASARSADNQLLVATSGNGCNPNARGQAVFCKDLFTGKTVRWERSDVAGIIAPEKIPTWAHMKLEEMGIPVTVTAQPKQNAVGSGNPFTHAAFEAELQQAMENFSPTADDLPLDAAGFSQELAAVIHTAYGDATHAKVYMGSFAHAREKDEIPLFKESQNLNEECARSIDKAIQDNYEGNSHYDLASALDVVSAQFGAERVRMVLANTMDRMSYDGRFSHTNKEWGGSIALPDQTDHHRSAYVCNTHPAVLDGFISRVRKVQVEKEKKPSVTERLKKTEQPKPKKSNDKSRNEGR